MLNRAHQFCQQFDSIASDSRNAMSNTIGDGDVYATETRVCGAYMASTHDRNFPIAVVEERVTIADARVKEKARRNSAIFNIRSALYIAAGDRRSFRCQTIGCRCRDRGMYNIDHRLLPTRVSLNDITSRVAVSVSAGNVTCRGYIAARARCRRFYA